MDPDRALELTRAEPRGGDVRRHLLEHVAVALEQPVLASVAGHAPVDVLAADMASLPAHVRRGIGLRPLALEHDRDRPPAEQVSGGETFFANAALEIVSIIASRRSFANAAM